MELGSLPPSDLDRSPQPKLYQGLLSCTPPPPPPDRPKPLRIVASLLDLWSGPRGLSTAGCGNRRGWTVGTRLPDRSWSLVFHWHEQHVAHHVRGATRSEQGDGPEQRPDAASQPATGYPPRCRLRCVSEAQPLWSRRRTNAGDVKGATARNQRVIVSSHREGWLGCHATHHADSQPTATLHIGTSTPSAAPGRWTATTEGNHQVAAA